MSDSKPSNETRKGYIWNDDGTLTAMNVTVGPSNDDDLDNYDATAIRCHEAEEALETYRSLKAEYGTACMRYMSNEPELGFPPYWELDHDIKAMERRVHGEDVRMFTSFALQRAGMEKEEARRVSGMLD